MNEEKRPRKGEQVGMFHVPNCGGRLQHNSGYGSSVVNCEKCGGEYPVIDVGFGELQFTGEVNA